MILYVICPHRARSQPQRLGFGAGGRRVDPAGISDGDGKWRLPVEPDKVDPLYRRMLIAAEDERFAWHPGVDPIAALRAAGQLAASGHVVSGASTLTMQVARLLERHPARWRQARRDGQGAGPRTAPVERAGARPLSDLGPVRRQSRRRAGGEPGLFRQGAGAAVGRGMRCWSRCRDRRSACGRTAIRKPRAPPATASSLRMAEAGVISPSPLPRRARRKCHSRASRCRFGRRIWRAHCATRSRAHRPTALRSIRCCSRDRNAVEARSPGARSRGQLRCHGRRQSRPAGARLCRQRRFRCSRRAGEPSTWRVPCDPRARP